jgi:asparagine synthase (glutamine-hydrolysing)
LKTAFGPAKGLLRLGLQALGNAGWKKVGRFSGLVDLPMSEYYLSRTATPDSGLTQLKGLYSKDFVQSLGNQEADWPTRRLFAHLDGKSPLDSMLYVDMKSWLPDDLLVKADKMTMATSVELRVPLLDFKVLEFAASLPADFKVRGWTTKRILKAALEDSVPQAIINRKKTGFPVPYDRWFRTHMKMFVSEMITNQNSSIHSYFSRNKVLAMLKDHQEEKLTSKNTFCLLLLELLLRQFADPNNHLSFSSRN